MFIGLQLPRLANVPRQALTLHRQHACALLDFQLSLHRHAIPLRVRCTSPRWAFGSLREPNCEQSHASGSVQPSPVLHQPGHSGSIRDVCFRPSRPLPEVLILYDLSHVLLVLHGWSFPYAQISLMLRSLGCAASHELICIGFPAQPRKEIAVLPHQRHNVQTLAPLALTRSIPDPSVFPSATWPLTASRCCYEVRSAAAACCSIEVFSSSSSSVIEI